MSRKRKTLCRYRVLFVNQSTSIDYQFVRMYNLNLETNEILLSSIVNPYRRVVPSKEFSDVLTFHRLGKEYKHRPTSTGDDFPHWWLRLTTDLILADFITNQGEEKEKSLPPPSPRHDQSIQTDVEKSRPSSTTTSNHYESIDELGDESHRQRVWSTEKISYFVDCLLFSRLILVRVI